MKISSSKTFNFHKYVVVMKPLIVLQGILFSQRSYYCNFILLSPFDEQSFYEKPRYETFERSLTKLLIKIEYMFVDGVIFIVHD